MRVMVHHGDDGDDNDDDDDDGSHNDDNHDDHDDGDITQIFQAYTRDEDYIQLARQVGIKRTTAYQIFRKALEHDGVVAFPRGGLRSVKMSEEMLETVIAIVSAHPDYTLIMINQELRVRLPGVLGTTCNTIDY
ncbi:hypothetical protein ElyMa_006401000 [Elysia marginata]|uniref:Uncharacterized protein n=1 Tax=Elysia marginata TaxID=1093978 RepID=A0AAV4HS25_9GAST|nr:hypothetical protein ElyMa_006401000 [Elysia marginata]